MNGARPERSAPAGGRDAAILAHHAEELLMLDFQATVRGIEAYDKTISFVPRDLEVTAGSDVAFATCLILCEGTSPAWSSSD